MSRYNSYGGPEPPRESGARRKRFAALAGTVYRAGAAAATELKEQYNNTRIRNVETAEGVSIPGAFPHVSIIHAGEEQMVLFPSYAKRHVKRTGELARGAAAEEKGGQAAAEQNEEEYWAHEWARVEDERAVVDVDVRGWIYMPSKGPMTRRNRMLIGLARRLSGIPTPTTVQGGTDVLGNSVDEVEQAREEKKIAKEAREIERKGRDEKEAAQRGDYSEMPREDDDSEAEAGVPAGRRGLRSRSGTATPLSPPGSPVLGPKGGFAPPSEMSEAELAVANANLMARIGPFMTTPLVQLPITLFFYNETQSQSRTVMTNDSGHFVTRVALDFVPTHVRVLANEKISAVEPIHIVESQGVSLISDIDDTIKRSNIALGAREIFRNTFIRDLGDLTIEGVKEWFSSLSKMGVQIHYCSNSPWQLFPVLATYFLTAGLPAGSIHLKHYSGMLQGIFEPVAERKKGTLERILRDFPDRKFLLVGDSGEADLEVYTELAIGHPGRILAVFIRDVTTPERVGYFDTSINRNLSQRSRRENTPPRLSSHDDDPAQRPSLPPRVQSEPSDLSKGPPTGILIDFSDEADAPRPSDKPSASTTDLLSKKSAPPPRPAKPAALRSAPSEVSREVRAALYASSENIGSLRPLAQQNNYNKRASETSGGASSSSNKEPASPSSTNSSRATPPPPPPPRRSGTSSLSNEPRATKPDVTAAEFEALPETIRPASIAMDAAQEPYNKKVDLWMQRLERAHEVLDRAGVKLYTWRRGNDVIKEAEGIVRDALRGR